MIISGKIPIYQQIYNQYKNYIKRGILENGEKLPSVRSLAKSLGINPNTVFRAFEMLEKASYIKTIPKKGFYVSYSNDVKTNDDYIGEQIKKWKKMGITREAIFEKINQIYIEKEGDSDDWNKKYR